MAETPRALLQRTLMQRYHILREQLARRLGSSDRASDALHDVWRHLQAKEDFPPIGQPEAYLYKAALNAAKNLRRTESRQTPPTVDAGVPTNLSDDAPGPARVAMGRAALEELQAALSELPLRQQVVFYERFLGDASQQDLADRFNVTVRTIQNDLHHAVEHCGRRLRKKFSFVSEPISLSGNREGSSS